MSVLPLLRDGRPNPDGLRLDDRRRRSSHQRFRAPRRTEVVEYLAAAGMLPAITFIFSRAACDDATRQVVAGRRAAHHATTSGPGSATWWRSRSSA